jgi:signal transduction histidine kinase
MERLLAHIERAPDVLRTNIYSREKRVLWSSDPLLTGQSFAGEANSELEAALAGDLEIHAEKPGRAGGEKAEHSNLATGDGYFIELYIPVWDLERRHVVGAVELYRAPLQLRETIASGVRMIWAGALGAAAVLFLALLPLVRRADAMIRRQRDLIVAAETQTAIGDLGSAVAHGIRNPRAVIRTSAELVKEGAADSARREAAADIMAQVDRLELWVRELLTYVHRPAGDRQPVDLEAVALDVLAQFEAELRRRGVRSEARFARGFPRVRGDATLLGQVLRSVVTNAIEAMPDGGNLLVCGDVGESGRVTVTIRDSGVGMSREQLDRALKPFHTTKAMGLGVGLPLARRIVERADGHIALSSRPGEGTAVELTLAVAVP